MANIFFISDTHFGHRGIVTFLRSDGEKLRPWNTTEEMDEALVASWNRVVSPKDKIFHLGDVVINRRCLPIVSRLNGRKYLVRGNHDTMRLAEYAQFFEDIYGVWVIDDFICSHVPLAKRCIRPRFKGNIHGHTHEYTMGDPDYFCVCVEQIGYAPIAFDAIKAIRGGGE